MAFQEPIRNKLMSRCVPGPNADQTSGSSRIVPSTLPRAEQTNLVEAEYNLVLNSPEKWLFNSCKRGIVLVCC